MFKIRPRSLVNYFIADTVLSHNGNYLRIYWFSKTIISYRKKIKIKHNFKLSSEATVDVTQISHCVPTRVQGNNPI